MNTPPVSAFDGVGSLRLRGEWFVLWACVAAILTTAPLLTYLFPSLASLKEFALLLIAAMIYVTFARGRLIGGSIRVHAGQFGHVHEIAIECAQALRMNVPNVFVRDDPFVPIVAVGMGDPYSLIISAQWVDHLKPGELRFLIGRELAHIDAGHTRVTSLLSVNGRENAVISIFFGAWLRRIEYTADRAGLLCCASLEDALSAISVSTFHLVGRKIDMRIFSEQQREIESDRALRIGEWIASTPYATKRIAALRAFARDPLFVQWSSRFESFRFVPYAAPPQRAGAVSRRTFANFPRRSGACIIDLIVMEALVPRLPPGFIVAGKAISSDPDTPRWLIDISRHPHVFSAVNGGLFESLAFFAYVTVLVGLTGQTFGMMILDLRVVSDRLGRIGIGNAVGRYICLIGSLLAVIGFVRIFNRIQPFEKWSRTRLVSGSAHARSRGSVTAPQFEAATP